MQLAIKNVCGYKHVCQNEAIHLFPTDDNNDYTSSSIAIHASNIIDVTDDNANKILFANLKYRIFLDHNDNYYYHFDIGIKYEHSEIFYNNFVRVSVSKS